MSNLSMQGKDIFYFKFLLIKFFSARINLSNSSDDENKLFNKNFKLIMNSIAPTINGIVAKKIADKLYPFFDGFNEAFWGFNTENSF